MSSTPPPLAALLAAIAENTLRIIHIFTKAHSISTKAVRRLS
jgi:hypothetical protein